jgi:hypothetical protein
MGRRSGSECAARRCDSEDDCAAPMRKVLRGDLHRVRILLINDIPSKLTL